MTKDIKLTRTVGLPAIFWLVMNKGQHLSSARKIFLTVVNLVILGIAIAIVSVRPTKTDPN